MPVVGSLISGFFKAKGAKAAANSQMLGAQQAQALEKQNQTAALGTQAQEWTQQQANQQPFLQTGQQSTNALGRFLQTPFQAPTLAEAEQTPGYQFTLQQGTNAIDQNAAANGTLLSGNTGTALEKYGQGLASTTYQQDYQNALNTYMTNYQTLLGGSQLGQTTAGQLGQEGQMAALNTGNIDLTGGAQQAQQINNAAAARASGYIGKANAYSGAVTGATNGFMDQMALAQLG